MQRHLQPIGVCCLILVSGCGKPASAPIREIDVPGSDYAFQVPDSLPPGEVKLSFQNTGKVEHEMAVALLKEGITLSRVMEIGKSGGSPDSLIDGIVGILIASPGQRAAGNLMVNLLPGRTYAFVCNFQDAPDQPPHMALGMVGSVAVSSP